MPVVLWEALEVHQRFRRGGYAGHKLPLGSLSSSSAIHSTLL
jgi:hypothetical protein